MKSLILYKGFKLLSIKVTSAWRSSVVVQVEMLRFLFSIAIGLMWLGWFVGYSELYIGVGLMISGLVLFLISISLLEGSWFYLKPAKPQEG